MVLIIGMVREKVNIAFFLSLPPRRVIVPSRGAWHTFFCIVQDLPYLSKKPGLALRLC
jgi:hypothetical protein